MRNGVTDKQLKALAMAMAGATVAAVATMFIPVAMLESVTGSTGISELVPATAAPLGDTARALIAFGVGALTLAVLGYVLPRQNEGPRAATAEPGSPPFDEPQDSISLKDRLAGFPWPKMPWAKGEDDITELSDLPKLRNGDIHPDAPPRRPLSAHHDLPVLELSEVAVPLAEELVTEPAAEFVTPALEAEQAQSFSPTPIAAADVQPTLAEMVAQLEAAVADRQKQLADLELVAAQLAAGRLEAVSAQPEPEADAEIVADVETIVEPAPIERPILEAVPSSPVKDEDMDAALAAALATLHRMNATGR